ncbi:ubiquitin carboxyl-terminal hydrolase 7-like [Contarinia nasturtii]|uniref:ubiquitin carboxyl-terminal hydrolase 7-like n=1 Tax=Contarinia nasturtii TaxID=265458 RepID=UPI0012D475C1|nr:ubiquitin carboxyl-terminal hydrolase 7-like [Contarinia nasturtii]
MKIKIEVTDPNDKDKSILKVDVLDKCCGLGSYISFRVTVSNIDGLVAVGTPEFRLRGLRWKMSIYNDASKWLGILLEIIGVDVTDEFTCNATAVVKLISTKDDAKTIKRVFEETLDKRNILGECEFVSWYDLFDDQKGFVRDNAIVLEVKIIAKQPYYAGRSGEKRQMVNGQNEDVELLKLECSICMEAIRDQEISSLPCTHMFCTKCIEDAIKARKKCPICNTAAELANLRRIRLPFAI